MSKSIFEYKDYKLYLRAAIAHFPKGGRGVRLALAKSIRVPISHISQVLNGASQLSLEQAEGVNEFLAHSLDEADFFLLLVQLARAGSPSLVRRLEGQMHRIIEKRFILKERLGLKTALSIEDHAIFYSSWVYGAVHVMLTIDRFQTSEAIGQYLGISTKRIEAVLEFLLSVGLAVPKEGKGYRVGSSRIHLGSDSPMISKFHTNWRIRSIQSLDKEDSQKDLHYSSAITISETDFVRIKSQLIKSIEEIKSIIRDSPEEGVHCFCIDFFRL